MRFTFIFLILLSFLTANAKPEYRVGLVHVTTLDSLVFSESASTNALPNPLLHQFKLKKRQNKQVVAAILAFPIPFGIVGLHRIYLGTAPYVPVAYIATLGGLFGILPFVDFCVLLLDSDIEKYKSNQKVFMWLN